MYVCPSWPLFTSPSWATSSTLKLYMSIRDSFLLLHISLCPHELHPSFMSFICLSCAENLSFFLSSIQYIPPGIHPSFENYTLPSRVLSYPHELHPSHASSAIFSEPQAASWALLFLWPTSSLWNLHPSSWVIYICYTVHSFLLSSICPACPTYILYDWATSYLHKQVGPSLIYSHGYICLIINWVGLSLIYIQPFAMVIFVSSQTGSVSHWSIYNLLPWLYSSPHKLGLSLIDLYTTFCHGYIRPIINWVGLSLIYIQPFAMVIFVSSQTGSVSHWSIYNLLPWLYLSHHKLGLSLIALYTLLLPWLYLSHHKLGLSLIDLYTLLLPWLYLSHHKLGLSLIDLYTLLLLWLYSSSHGLEKSLTNYRIFVQHLTFCSASVSMRACATFFISLSLLSHTELHNRIKKERKNSQVSH
jgi:hypothetical protein